jgi:UDP-N-acetylmuramoyl-L-alanyl-D-glutamate--2,6-diaminopimelate ligase
MNMPAAHIDNRRSLAEILDGIAEAPELPIDDIAMDSRRVGEGCVFFAIAGASHHGLEFSHQVVSAGAVAIVFDASTAPKLPEGIDIPLLPVAKLAEKLGKIADRFFGQPSAQLRVHGVTGTNGKSTVAWLLAQCLGNLGKIAAYSGTLGYGVNELENDDDMTSPDVVETHRRLAGFVAAGAQAAAIEVSSHALDQGRVDAVRFDTAMFTNLSRDHLDYHGDMRAYGEAKARLFVEHAPRQCIVNLDSDFGAQLAARCGDNAITVSTMFDRDAEDRPYVIVRSIEAHPAGSKIAIDSSWGEARVDVPLIGGFNVENAVLVLASLLSTGVSLPDACQALSLASAPPGRMQRVPAATGPAVFIDYAHTPDALDVALRAVRVHTRGQMWCVFGCGGDRDTGKRAAMGRAAERLSDSIVITNDNPRSEQPADIFADICRGLQSVSQATIIEDRAAAIAWAIARAGAGDVVVVAGKGHENYQVIGDQRLEFSDYDVAAGNLAGRNAELVK